MTLAFQKNIDRVQVKSSTSFFRYYDFFHVVRDWIATTHGSALGGKKLRILSFGCSSGEECFGLRAFFPQAAIFGCDIDLNLIRNAKRKIRDNNMFLFPSSNENIKLFAPYDIIFCMSVLCRYPESRELTNLCSVFPFTEFERSIEELANVISYQGVIVIYNASYSFKDCHVSERFWPIRSQRIFENGYVDKFSRSAAKVAATCKAGDEFYYEVVGAEVDDALFTDCVYARDRGSESNLPASEDAVTFTGGAPPLAIQPKPPALSALSAPGLVYGWRETEIHATSPSDFIAVRRSWRRSVTGRDLSIGTWVEDVSREEAGLMSPDEVHALTATAAPRRTSVGARVLGRARRLLRN